MFGEPADDGLLASRKRLRAEGLPSFPREVQAPLAIPTGFPQRPREGKPRFGDEIIVVPMAFANTQRFLQDGNG